MAENSLDIKIPFKMRVNAWWKGYDLDDVRNQMRDSDEEEGGAADSPEPPVPQGEKKSSLEWDDLRIKTTQIIWGDGYCGPGGKGHIEKMCKLLAMNSEMSAVVVGAGLGGPARVLAEEFGVWINGYELSGELAKRGMKMSTDAGIGTKAQIQYIDPTQPDPFDRKYERAFSKEALYCFPDKDKILKDIFDTLKADSLFLITDYTLSDISVLENPDVQKWIMQEPSRPYPVPSATMTQAIEKAGFSIRVNEDISSEYVELIEKSWSKATDVAKQMATQGEAGLAAIKALMEEAEFWALRAKILKEGQIHVYRYLASKPKKKIR